MKTGNHYKRISVFIPLLLLYLMGVGQESREELTLWFKQPASQWNEALPVGNGQLGAMVYGGVEHERLQLNEESVWSKGATLSDKQGGYKALPEIRDLLFEGKYQEAEQMCLEELMSERPPTGTNAYQTLGKLKIHFQGVEDYRGYKRELQLDQALVKTRFYAGRATHTRTVFSSAPDQALVMMAEASKPGQITCTLGLDRVGKGEQVRVKKGLITMSQQLNGGKGVGYQARLRVIPHGGTMKKSGRQLHIEGADKLELRLVAATDYRGGDPGRMCRKNMKALESKDYQQILKDHIDDYQQYFNRVSLELPTTQAAGFATDERIDAQKRGVYDPSLTSLYFQFGRYLLISSSRPGSMPANLQGIWVEGTKPPWNSDYHININLQMNYWPAEVTNLSDCHMPFLQFIGELQENGSQTARELYGADGFTVHHTTDAWHMTTAFGKTRYGMWPMGAAWASTHIWEHYLFTEDETFLREYGYPVMKEAARFMSDFLVRHPETGQWITGPSMSPENVFVTPEGKEASVCMGPAMDLQIVWHLFTSCIEASRVLDQDAAFRKTLQDQLNQLTPVRIGEEGRILEWSNPGLKEAQPGHRHMSHLYGLYPSHQYNWKDQPEYMKAAAKVIEHRLEHGGGHTGWSRAWMINFYARLMDRENVWDNLVKLWSQSTLSNMFNSHPPFQIDGNFGGTAGIAEMLLQSHTGEVHLLPCLPDELPRGEVRGLMARGGHQVDIQWDKGHLQRATIQSTLGNPVKVRYGAKVIEFPMEKGEKIILDQNLKVVERSGGARQSSVAEH